MELIIPLTVLIFIGWFYMTKALDRQDSELKRIEADLVISNQVFIEAFNLLDKRNANYKTFRQIIAAQFDIINENTMLIQDILNKHEFYIERNHVSFLDYYWNNLHLKRSLANTSAADIYAEVRTPEEEMAFIKRKARLDQIAVEKGWAISLTDDSSSYANDSEQIS